MLRKITVCELNYWETVIIACPGFLTPEKIMRSVVLKWDYI